MYFPSGNHAIQINERTNDRTNKRLLGAILFSLLVHAFVLTLQMGLPGIGMPSIALPWAEKRAIPVPAPLQIRIATAAPQMQSDELKVKDEISINKTDQSVKSPLTKVASLPSKEKLKEDQPKQVKALTKSDIVKTNGLRLVKSTIVKPASTIAADSSSHNKAQKIKPQAIKLKQVIKANQAEYILPKLKTPVRLITQDQALNNDFIVPFTPPEEIEEPTRAQVEKLPELEAIPAESLVNKEILNRSNLLVENIKDELQKMQDEKIAQMATQIALKEEERQQKIAKEEALLVQESLRQELEKQEKLKALAAQTEALKTLNELAQQNQIVFKKIDRAPPEATQVQFEKQPDLTQNRQAELKRLEDRGLAQIQEEKKLRIKEEKQQEQALQKIAELKLQQEQLEQQEKQKQLAVAQVQQKQKELELQLEKQRTLELQEKKKNEDLIAQQALSDKKAQEKLLAEKVIAAASAQIAKTKTQNSAQNNEKDSKRESGNSQASQNDFGLSDNSKQAPSNLPQASLANRLRDQARRRDLFKAPLPKMVEEKMNVRKRSFLGAFDKEVPLRMYVDSLKGKLERNGNLIYEKRSVGNEETTLLVNMIVRSDGSIDDVIIIRSSGSYAVDEKVKNIILTNAPYAKFPPNVAAKYDVIEVQRIWNFGDKLRIYDELR